MLITLGGCNVHTLLKVGQYDQIKLTMNRVTGSQTRDINCTKIFYFCSSNLWLHTALKLIPRQPAQQTQSDRVKLSHGTGKVAMGRAYNYNYIYASAFKYFKLKLKADQVERESVEE